ncbi:hypothetical protein ACFQU2_14120 [Siccirubricoccus deserti]
MAPQAGASGVWPDHAARFYAAALDRSDYAAAAAAALRGLLGIPASLLDIGAGAGQPVAGWLPATAHWTALEPNRYLRARLGRLARTTHPRLRPLAAPWEALPGLGLPRHGVALAANIAGPMAEPHPLLALMRRYASGAVAWIVPAQRGPRRWCLSGALPAALHGEDEQPAVALVLERLGAVARPDRSAVFPWTFRARFADAGAAIAHCAAQLALAPDAPCHAALAAHLDTILRPLPEGGVELAAPKLSALLAWDLA